MDFKFKNISNFGLVLRGNKESVLLEPGKMIIFSDKAEMDLFSEDINVFLGTKLEQVRNVSNREVSFTEVLVESPSSKPTVEMSKPRKRRGRRAKQ